MGRETVAVVHWRGQTAESKVLLESGELILRGGIKGRIPRSAIANARRSERGVAFVAADEPCLIEMNPNESERWLTAFATKPRSLASKLNISPESPAYVIGAVDDESLSTALNEATAGNAVDATTIIAVLSSLADLKAALGVAQTHPTLPLWCVYGKGPQAGIGETEIRTYLRAHAYMDTKISSISSRLTATRYNAKQ